MFPSTVGDVAGRSNDILLYGNPDRGYRTTLPLVIYAEHKVDEEVRNTCDLIKVENGKYSVNTTSACYGKHSVEVMYANLDETSQSNLLGYMIDNVYFLGTSKTDYLPKLQLLQLSLPDYRTEGEHLPQEVLDVLQLVFNKMREMEVRILFRIGYHNVTTNLLPDEEGQVSQEIEELREKAYVSKDTMLTHITDIANFFNIETANGKNVELINKMSSGFIGQGGEMARNYQWPRFNDSDYNDVINEIIQKICMPYDLYYTVRSQKYKNAFVAQYPKYAKLVGTNNDAVFGEQEILGHHSGCYQVNHNFSDGSNCSEGASHTQNLWWEQATAEAAYTPQSGEMYHGVHLDFEESPTGLDVIKEMAHHRFVTLSQWNGYENGESQKVGDITYLGDSAIQRWINDETVTKQKLDENGIIYDPAWFIDENGEEITNRNPYEFMRDHLGYKLVGQEFTVQGLMKKGRTVSAKLSLKNYGFAAAFGLESSFVVLDEDGDVVSSVKAGNPDEWISLPADYYTQDRNISVQEDVCEYTIKADIELPEESGTYRIALLLENSMHDTARLSNAADANFYYTGYEGSGRNNTNGYNVLMTFDVE